MSDTDFTEADKKIMIEAMGEGIGKAVKDFEREIDRKTRESKITSDQRWESTVERLTKIETKIDLILERLQND